jgi:hypothetical protein
MVGVARRKSYRSSVIVRSTRDVIARLAGANMNAQSAWLWPDYEVLTIGPCLDLLDKCSAQKGVGICARLCNANRTFAKMGQNCQ